MVFTQRNQPLQKASSNEINCDVGADLDNDEDKSKNSSLIVEVKIKKIQTRKYHIWGRSMMEFLCHSVIEVDENKLKGRPARGRRNHLRTQEIENGSVAIVYCENTESSLIEKK